MNSQLQLAHQQRLLTASSWVTVLLPSRSSFATGAAKGGKEYADKVAEGGRGHGLGPPHPHVLMSAMDAAKEDEELPAELRRQLSALTAALEKLTIDEVGGLVTHFQAKQAYQREGEAGRHKVTLAIDPLYSSALDGFETAGLSTAMAVRALLMQTMVQLGGEHLKGAAPRGPLERALQRHLKKTQTHLGMQ